MDGWIDRSESDWMIEWQRDAQMLTGFMYVRTLEETREERKCPFPLLLTPATSCYSGVSHDILTITHQSSKGKHARTCLSSALPSTGSTQCIVDLLTLSWRVRLWLYSVSHYTKLVTTGEGQCKDQWLNLELCSVAWLTFATMLQQSATDMLASSQYHCPSSSLITSGN